MLLNVVFTGRNPTTHELRSDGRAVERIRPGLVGFGGFTCRAEAQGAGRAAVGVLDAWCEEREQPIGRHAPASWKDHGGDEDLLEASERTEAAVMAGHVT